VIVRAGDRSLHPQWTRALATRDWDLVVSYFGNDPDRYRGPGEKRIDDKGPKWPALHALLTRDDFWRGYDYIWLPDDDLAITQESISRLFELSASLEVALSQPALSWTSFYAHPVTLRFPSFRVRFTDFAEIMAPCFEHSFLEVCMPTFGENLSGWGLNWVWPRLQNAGSPRIAIIDDSSVTHTRPVGGPNYAKLRESGIDARDERDEVLRKYGVPLDVEAHLLSAIDRDGNRLDAAKSRDAKILAERCHRDWTDFLASRQRLDLSRLTLPTRFQHRVGRGKWGW